MLARSFVFSGFSTQAADLPAKAVTAPAVIAAATNPWSGFYIGVNGGYGFGRNRISDPSSGILVSGGLLRSGYAVGGYAGYNWQHGILVGGLEADMNFAKLDNTIRASGPFVAAETLTVTEREKVDYFGSVRGRVGAVVWQNLFLYGTGGLAWNQVKIDATQTVFTPVPPSTIIFTNSASNSEFGFVVGAGAEYIVANFGSASLLWRVEGLHYDFGSSASATTTVGAATAASSLGRPTIDLVRSGVSLKF